MIETYNGLTWDVDELPVGSSTPDDLFEVSFRAETRCPNCGDRISGTANYWSRDETMIFAWLHDIIYDPCECEDWDEDKDEYEDIEDMDDTIN